jgi:hypothetical protein
MKRYAPLLFSIILLTSFHFSLPAKDSNDRINLAAALESSIEAPVWNCDLPSLQNILGKYIALKDVQAVIVLSDCISCSVIRSEAIEPVSVLNKSESAKNTILSTVIRDNIRAYLEKLSDRSQKKELEEIELKINRNGNEVGVLVIYFSMK